MATNVLLLLTASSAISSKNLPQRYSQQHPNFACYVTKQTSTCNPRPSAGVAAELDIPEAQDREVWDPLLIS